MQASTPTGACKASRLPPPPPPACPLPVPAHNTSRAHTSPVPTSSAPQSLLSQWETHMAGMASSGALIRVPSFNRWQNSSLICTPGYGEAPDGRNGVGGWKQVPVGQPSIPVTSAQPPWWGAGPTSPDRAWPRCSPPPEPVIHLVTGGGTACYGLETH